MDEFLKPLQSASKKRRIVVIDFESKHEDTQEKGFTRPFLVSFLHGQHCEQFRNDSSTQSLPWNERHLAKGGLVDKLMRFITGLEYRNPKPRKTWQNKKCLIYAHNGGKFDWLFILGWLLRQRRFLKFEIASTQSRIQRLDVWPRGQSKKKGCWTFLDSVSLLPMSLKKVGETFCPILQKMTMELDLDEHDPLWEKYNRLDCEVLRKGLRAFHKLIEKLGGEVGITAPATAMKLFRKKFLKEHKWIFRNAHFKSCEGRCYGCKRLTCEGACHGCLHDFVRQGYYGGRTELFAEHGYDIRYYDINSSYPASMLANMPVGPTYELGRTNEKQLELMHKSCVGFVHCEVFIPNNCPIPPLPYRDREKKKLIFPVGRFSGVWDYDELLLLKDVGGKIEKIYQSVWFKKAPIFKHMVETLYAYRDKSRKDYNEGLSYCAKLMLNSLYGKFGMREDRTALVLVPEGDSPPLDKGWPTNGNVSNCLIWEVENIANAPYIIPQISAHITALSRIRLFKAMLQIQKKKGNLLYVDTDSIMCEGVEIEESTKLGGWKREEPGILLEGYFVLPKLYRLLKHDSLCVNEFCDGCKGSVQKMKGVGGKAQNPENWEAITNGGTVSFPRVMQHRTMLNKGIASPEIVNAKKSIRSVYDKRILLKNGKTKPIVMGKT